MVGLAARLLCLMNPPAEEYEQALRRLPAVDRVLQALADHPATGLLPRSLVTTMVRRELDQRRTDIRAGLASDDGPSEIITGLERRIDTLSRQRLRGVINGTGVVLHTNLGRSPLSEAAVQRVVEVAGGYSNLEFDLAAGERGRRGAFLEAALAEVCGAEAATVVNNCAAALILILRHLARPPHAEVIISRGELIEIGGGFRIPEILETSGARLREVGTTNRTRPSDFKAAIGAETGLLMKVHRSNFYQEGFVEEPSLADLVGLGQEHEIPVVFDLGSGAVDNTEEYAALPHEPTVAEALAEGADLVCVSGDKLLGGPQAGIIAGRSELIADLKRNPLFRALRCDKMVFAALQETILAYLKNPAAPAVPPAELLAIPSSALEARAAVMVEKLDSDQVRVGTGTSRCGGGTMPKAAVPSVTLEIKPAHLSVDQAARHLRLGESPVVAFVSEGILKIDLRTVLPRQDAMLIGALQDLLRVDAASAQG